MVNQDQTNQTIHINQKLQFHQPGDHWLLAPTNLRATVGFISFGISEEEEKERSQSEDVLQLSTGGE